MTVKCRIGVDDRDSYEWLSDFVETVATQGEVKQFFVVRHLFFSLIHRHSASHIVELLLLPPACS